MTARASSSAVLVLADTAANAEVSSGVVLVLWGLDSSAQVSQANVLLLGRIQPRRIIGITD